MLAAVSMCFALGAATTEQFKHLTAAEAGPLTGLGTLPGLRTLRPRLAQIADAADPVAVQRLFASAMLAATRSCRACTTSMTIVPYTGAKPVAKGWNNKRGRAERGARTPTSPRMTAGGVLRDRGAVRAEHHAAAGPGGAEESCRGCAKIMLGFDRGGAYPQVFRHCREQDVHWVTYRRAPLAVPAMLPVITTITVAGRPARSPGPRRKCSSKTTARPGRSRCSSTARSYCRS